ncbi:MAG: hypothetical protein AAB300_00300 [Nitrospirota bacterium]
MPMYPRCITLKFLFLSFFIFCLFSSVAFGTPSPIMGEGRGEGNRLATVQTGVNTAISGCYLGRVSVIFRKVV